MTDTHQAFASALRDECIVCGGEEKVGEWSLSDAPGDKIPVCETCYDDGEFAIWLKEEIQAACEEMVADGRMQKLPDGRWLILSSEETIH
jgi:hypothetical protein